MLRQVSVLIVVSLILAYAYERTNNLTAPYSFAASDVMTFIIAHMTTLSRIGTNHEPTHSRHMSPEIHGASIYPLSFRYWSRVTV